MNISSILKNLQIKDTASNAEDPTNIPEIETK